MRKYHPGCVRQAINGQIALMAGALHGPEIGHIRGILVWKFGARGRNRTGTAVSSRGIFVPLQFSLQHT